MIATQRSRSRWVGVALGLALVCSAKATSVPRISFEELTDKSEVIASGQVTRSWSDWDPTHKYIWTHYELTVANMYKGQATHTVVISEPGGVVGNIGMQVAGSVVYQAGNSVLVFLERMPNGYLRTTGWGQGQYRVDGRGTVHASESLRQENVLAGVGSGSSLTSLDGVSVTELARRVTVRVQTRRPQ
jgi:hypothetical protein